jgi:small subunit ribosomal protein S6
MPLYECVLLARNDLTQQQVEAIADQIAAITAEYGGEVKKREYWGLRTLAYKIKKNRKAHYMLVGLDCPSATEREIDRQLRLNEDVLRHLTVRVEELDDQPSAMLSKRSDDRGFRGPKPAGRFASGRGRERDEREEFRARGRDEIEGEE